MFGNVDYTKMMYGQNAIHVPMWMVVQGLCFTGGCKAPEIRYGSNHTHQIILGEMIIRPHIVVASSDFAGYGLEGFITSNPSAEEWLRNGEILVRTGIGEHEFMKWR